MAASIKSRLVRGETVENNGSVGGGRFYESGVRRARRCMCDPCKHGSHSPCESEACPCVCNDSDFKWSRKNAVRPELKPLTSDPELARVIDVRPELRPLFFS